jgi:spermidine/putrescine transport system substrate-binding protein
MNTHITLLTWPDYINPETMVQFEAETGVGVHLEIVPSAVELVARVKGGENPPDVLVLSAEGRLLPLDHSLLPNLIHLEPRFQRGRAHDPDSQVSLIKDWGTTGFMFRTDRIGEEPASWADFWRLAAKYSGRVTVLDSPGEVIGAALKLRGHSYNDCLPETLAGARDDLLRLRPHLLAFETGYKPLLASGEACLALGWNGDAAALGAQDVPIKYVIPSEGSQLWEDDWAIAVNAPNPDLAHEFLNFVMRPEIAAQEAHYTRYATGNRDALALLEDAMRNDVSTYPPGEVLSKLEAGIPLDAAGQVRRQPLWKEFRG